MVARACCGCRVAEQQRFGGETVYSDVNAAVNEALQRHQHQQTGQMRCSRPST